MTQSSAIARATANSAMPDRFIFWVLGDVGAVNKITDDRSNHDDLLSHMNIDEWVKKTDLSSPIARRAVLLVGRDGVSPTKADGSGVFVGDRLIMTARHVVQWYWDSYDDTKVKMDRPGKKMAAFEMFAVQAQGSNVEPALWAASKLSVCPYSDLALISVVPVNELAKTQPPLAPLRLSILPPTKGEKIAAFGFASTNVEAESGQQVKFDLNPSTATGIVTDVFSEKRDSCLLSFPSFQVEAHFIGGMSGGPIFNEAGELCGLVCSGGSGDEDVPISSGVVLWPMVGIRIDHRIPSVITQPPYTILELAKVGLMDVPDWQYVETHVKQYEDPDGTKKIRLKD
jgi:hypothetical protein